MQNNNNIINAKVYWNLKGHTKRMCPAEDILDGWHWPEENYNSGTELMIYINPILVNRQWFEADIEVCHRSKSVRGKRHVQIGDRWIVEPAIIPESDVDGRICKDDEFILNVMYYNRPFHTLSSDIIKQCIDGFAYGRQKFLEIFRNENVGCT